MTSNIKPVRTYSRPFVAEGADWFISIPVPISKNLAAFILQTTTPLSFLRKNTVWFSASGRRLEARRLLRWCQDLGDDARILDIGCGDGFHLELLRDFGNQKWTIEGIDADDRASSMARRKGLTVHCGLLSELDLPKESYDLAILIQTVEHVADPSELLNEIRKHLRPGGRLCIVTDNTDSFDFRFFKGRYWGGYHFPRHWNLFNPANMRLLARKTGMEVESLATQVSPVNWVYSVRNRLTDKLAPSWLIEQFSLKSPVSLTAFTLFDALNNLIGRGACPAPRYASPPHIDSKYV